MNLFTLQRLVALGRIRDGFFAAAYYVANGYWNLRDRAEANYAEHRRKQTRIAAADVEFAANELTRVKSVAAAVKSTERADISAFNQNL